MKAVGFRAKDGASLSEAWRELHVRHPSTNFCILFAFVQTDIPSLTSVFDAYPTKVFGASSGGEILINENGPSVSRSSIAGLAMNMPEGHFAVELFETSGLSSYEAGARVGAWARETFDHPAVFVMSAGWKEIGDSKIVPRAEGNRVFETDGRPALELYHDYVGVESERELSTALEFPLQVDRRDGTAVLRAVVGINGDRSVIFNGNIPENATIHLSSPPGPSVTKWSGRFAERGGSGMLRLLAFSRMERSADCVEADVTSMRPHIPFCSCGIVSPRPSIDLRLRQPRQMIPSSQKGM